MVIWISNQKFPKVTVWNNHMDTEEHFKYNTQSYHASTIVQINPYQEEYSATFRKNWLKKNAYNYGQKLIIRRNTTVMLWSQLFMSKLF